MLLDTSLISYLQDSLADKPINKAALTFYQTGDEYFKAHNSLSLFAWILLEASIFN